MSLTRSIRKLWRTCLRAPEQARDGLSWWRARRLFQRSGLFAALPLTGTVLEVEGDRGHLAEAAVHHIPNRRCIVVDSARVTRQFVDRRVRRRKFHRVSAPPDRLPFADGALDAAWTGLALARLDAAGRTRVLTEMLRVVRPGGVLVAIGRRPDPTWRAVLSQTGWRIDREIEFDEAGLWRGRTFVGRRPL